MTILIFFAVLFILILVHEWGHFIVAKKNGIRVDEFGIGFPPKLFGIKKGETEYTFNALPIGGFVRIWGENAEEAFSPVADEGSDRRSEAIAEAGEGGSPVPSPDGKSDVSDSEAGLGGTKSVQLQKAEDFDRSFVAQSKLVQAAVLIAGVTMNVLFAWFLFSLAFAFGVPGVIDESNATDASQLIISEVMPDSPAAKAGIPAGAVVTGLSSGVDVDQILYPSSFSAFTEDHGDVEMQVTYRVGDKVTVVSLRPEIGIIPDNADRPAVGVSLALIDTVREPAHIAVWRGFLSTVYGLRDVTVGLVTLLHQSIVGKADLSQVAGPVGIVSLVGDAAAFGFTSLLMFTAFISLNLAVINMLPVPALDGGRLLFVAIEAIRRKPINPVWTSRVNFAGFALLLLLMLVITVNDISRIL